MEGPSLYLAAEQLIACKGQRIKVVSGNTKIGKERLQGKVIKDIFAWGKHLVIQFDTFALRTHFLLFGTFEATIAGKDVTGDYKRTREPRIVLSFRHAEIRMFNCSLKYLETADAKATYDFSIDIMSPAWDRKQALRHMREHDQEEVADVLLDQAMFAGVGNIIKNEVLSIVRVNPKTQVVALPDAKVHDIITVTHAFSQQFYLWRKAFVLRKHLCIYRKKYCPHCGGDIMREKTGTRQRWSYFCPQCQPEMGII